MPRGFKPSRYGRGRQPQRVLYRRRNNQSHEEEVDLHQNKEQVEIEEHKEVSEQPIETSSTGTPANNEEHKFNKYQRKNKRDYNNRGYNNEYNNKRAYRRNYRGNHFTKKRYRNYYEKERYDDDVDYHKGYKQRNNRKERLLEKEKNREQGKKRRKNHYLEHITEAEALAGIESGKYFAGDFRVNPYLPRVAYVSTGSLKTDTKIEGNLLINYRL